MGIDRAQAENYERKVNRIAERDLIPATDTRLVPVSSENLPNNRRAVYAIDGNPHTVWHSQFSGELAEHPHELVMDLGATYEIRGFRYLARRDSSRNGTFAKTEFYVSNSSDTFGKPTARGTFKKVRISQAADCEKPVRGRYVLVRILSEVNKKPWASAAEIGVIGSK
jgi:alpha-glucosidase